MTKDCRSVAFLDGKIDTFCAINWTISSIAISCLSSIFEHHLISVSVQLIAQFAQLQSVIYKTFLSHCQYLNLTAVKFATCIDMITCVHP